MCILSMSPAGFINIVYIYIYIYSFVTQSNHWCFFFKQLVIWQCRIRSIAVTMIILLHNFNFLLVILLVLNISVRSLQACKESHLKVANFQMCIILSCARGNIDVFSPVTCLVGILYEG